MRWFLGCRDTEKIQRELPMQSIDVFVAQKRVDGGTPIAFFVEVYQEKGWSHESLLVSSSLGSPRAISHTPHPVWMEYQEDRLSHCYIRDLVV